MLGEKLKTAFRDAAHYVRENKLQSAALLTSLLLGTTALATPAISTALGAGVILAASIALLLETGKMTVQNTLALGTKFKLSGMALGLIIGSLNTIPEVMVSMQSVFRGAIELGLGNIVGSNIAHTMFILGATAALAGIGKAKDLGWKFNTLVMAGASAAFGSQMVYGHLVPEIGAAMILAGLGYLANRIYNAAKKETHDHHHGHDHHDHDHDHDHDHENPGTCVFHDHGDEKEDHKALERPRWLNLALAGGGMLGLTAAADLIVRSGISLADKFNFAAGGFDFTLSEAVVGAVIVAIGGALPELKINYDAIKKNHSDLAVGNILGCTIVNTLIAGGALSLTGAPVPESFSPASPLGIFNIGMFMGTAALLTATLLATKGAMTRLQGGIALSAYIAYFAGTLALGDGKTPPVHQHGHDSGFSRTYTQEKTASRPILINNSSLSP